MCQLHTVTLKDWGRGLTDMPKWEDDARIWERLDVLMGETWLPLKELLDVIVEYRDEIPLQGEALMFGGLGTFVMRYNELRMQGANNPQTCLFEAVLAVQNDRRVRQFMGHMMESQIDENVQKMQEEYQ